MTSPAAESPTAASIPARPDRADTFTWSVHLLRREPGRLARLVVCFAAVTFCSALWFGATLAACVPVLALLLSVAEYVFPITYTLNETVAKSACGPIVLEIAWDDVRHAYLADDGVKLSPLRTPGSRLEPMRGVFLRFAGNQDAVVAAVRRFRGQEAAHG